MEVPDHLKVYYESGTIFQYKIHGGSEMAAYHLLVDCHTALSDKWSNIEKFLDVSKNDLMEILGRKRLNDIYVMYESSKDELLAQIKNGGMEVETKTFNMWKKLYGLVPDKLVELSIDQLANSQKLFEIVKRNYGIAPPQDLGVKSQIVDYFTDVLKRLKPGDFAEIIRFKNVISKPDYNQIVEADKELFSFINKTKETILSSIDNRAEEICGIIGTEIGTVGFISCPNLKMHWYCLKVRLWYLNSASSYISSVNPIHFYAVCALALLLIATSFVLYKHRAYETKKQLSFVNENMSTVAQAQFQNDPIHSNPILMV